MILDSYETLHCDAGWRKFSFLRLVAQDGTTGISEYNESYAVPGIVCAGPCLSAAFPAMAGLSVPTRLTLASELDRGQAARDPGLL